MSRNRNNNNNNNNRNNNRSRSNNNRRRRRPFNKGIFAVKALFFFVTIAAVAVGWLFAGSTIERFVNHNIYGNDISRALVTAEDAGLRVHFIDVGQGDAILVEFPNGTRMMVDAGHRRAQRQLSEYLNSNIFAGVAGNNRRIDYLVFTHSDADHIGNGSYLLQNYNVGTVYRPPSFTTDEITRRHYYHYYGYYLQGITPPTEHNTVGWRETTRDMYIYADYVLMNSAGDRDKSIGGVYVRWLAPVSMFWQTSNTSFQRNNISTIISLEYNDRTILLTGDATRYTESEALELSTFPRNIDVLQVGHHGSNSSSSPVFLTALNPTYAIISVGQNTYGHPTDRVLRQLRNYGGIESHRIYTTLRNGNIVAVVDSATGNIRILSGIENDDINIWVPYWGIFVPILVIIFGALFANDLVRLATFKKRR